MQFEAALSELYQYKPLPDVPGFKIPVPLPILSPFPTPSPPKAGEKRDSLTSSISNAAPNVQQKLMLSEDEIYDDFMASFADTAPVNIRMSAAQVSALKQRVMSALGSKLRSHLSSQDVITALIVSAINRSDPGHISQVLTMVNVSLIFHNLAPNFDDPKISLYFLLRHGSAMKFRGSLIIEPNHYGGNSISTAMTKILSLEEQTDLSLVALAVRDGMVEIRNQEILHARVAAAQADGVVWANAGVSRRITQPRGRAIVNSTVK